MAKKKYQIVGRVVGRGSRQGVPDARVEAWDKELLIDDKVGSAVTGADGSFKIEFDSFRVLDKNGKQVAGNPVCAPSGARPAPPPGRDVNDFLRPPFEKAQPKP